MNKKLMAVAVAGALGAPALAMAQATSTGVTIYGRVNVGVDNYAATGATAANGAGGAPIYNASGSGGPLAARNRGYDTGSRFGVRGSEDLGGGLSAVFVIESGVNVDTGSQAQQNGAANASTGFFASRDSYGGLQGRWGRVSVGRQSVFWTNGTISQSGANYVNIDVPMATVGGGFGRVPGVGTRFNNTVMYTLPTLAGFGGYVSYTPQSEATQNATAGTQTNSKTEGLRVTYEGRVKVQADWATNMGADTPNNTQTPNRITGLKLGVGFPYAPGAQVSVIVGKNTNHNTVAQASFTNAGDTVSQNAFVVNWEQIFGPIQALAMAGKTTNAHGCQANNTITTSGNGAPVGGCSDTGAVSFMVGAKYLLSKRTGAYFTYNQTNNSGNGCIDYTAAGYSSAVAGAGVGSCGLAPGSDPRIWALGVMHNF